MGVHHITAAVRTKMEINQARTWAKDDRGVFSHVKEAPLHPNALDNPPGEPEAPKSGTSAPVATPARAFREWQALCDNAERRGVPPDEVGLCEMVEPATLSEYQCDVINAHLDMMDARAARCVRSFPPADMLPAEMPPGWLKPSPPTHSAFSAIAPPMPPSMIAAHSADMDGVHEAAVKLLRDAGYTVTKSCDE